MKESMETGEDVRRRLRRMAFENICSVKWGTEFQSFFEKLMRRAHPSFVTIRPAGREGDWKCDGFLTESKTLYQVYAPIIRDVRNSAKKIEEDFVDALDKWRFDKWVFVYGARGLEKELRDKADSLGRQHNINIQVYDNEFIWNMLKELSPEVQDEILGLPARADTTIEELLEIFRDVVSGIYAKRVSSRFSPLPHVLPDINAEPVPMRQGGPALVDFVSDAVMWRGAVMDDILRELAPVTREKRFGSVLLSGASGCGKTTAALHLGFRLLQKGWKVYYAEASEVTGHDQETVDIFGTTDDDTLLIIDNVNVDPRTVRFLINGFMQIARRQERSGFLRVLLVSRTTDLKPFSIELSSLLRQVDKTFTLTVDSSLIEMLVSLVESFTKRSLGIDMEIIARYIGSELPILSELVDQWLTTGQIDRDRLSEFALERRMEGIRGPETKTCEQALLVISVFSRMFCMTSYRYLHQMLSKSGFPQVTKVLDDVIDRGHLRRDTVEGEVLLGMTHPSTASLILESMSGRLVDSLKSRTERVSSITDAEEYLVSDYVSTNPPDMERFLQDITSYAVLTGRLGIGPAIFDSLRPELLRKSTLSNGLCNLGVILHSVGRLEDAGVALRKALELDSTLPETWANLGMLLQRQGALDGAEKALRKAVELERGNPILWSNLGILLSERKDYDEATMCHEMALKIDPTLGLLWMNYGTLLREQGKLEEARGVFEEALRRDPSLSDAWFNLGVLLHEQGRQEDAEVAFKKASEYNPYDYESFFNRGRILQGIGKTDAAEEAYRTALKLNPRLSPAWTNLGAILVDRGRTSEGETAYGRAIEANPDNATAWYNLGKLLEETGRILEAESADKRATELSPDNADAWSNLAVLYERQGRFNESLDAHRMAIKHGSDNPSIWYNYGVLLRKTKEFKKALEANRTAIRLKPDHVSARHNLSVVLMEMGRIEEARTEFEETLNMESQSHVLWKDYATCLSRMGLLRESECALKRALEIDNEYAEAWFGLGTVFKRLNSMSSAEEALVHATELKNDYPEAWLNLANLYTQLGHLDKAETAYRTAIEHRKDYARAWSYLGLVLMRKGDFAEAEEAMLNATRFDDSLPDAWINLSALLKTVGRFDESTRAFLRGKALAARAR